MARKRKGRGKPGSFGSRLTRVRQGIAQRLASLQDPDYGKVVIHVGTNDIRDCSSEEMANTYVQLVEMMGSGDQSTPALRYLEGPGGADMTLNTATGEVAMTDKEEANSRLDLSPWVVGSLPKDLGGGEVEVNYLAVGGQLCGRHTLLPHQRQTLRFLRKMMPCQPPQPTMPPGGMDVLTAGWNAFQATNPKTDLRMRFLCSLPPNLRSALLDAPAFWDQLEYFEHFDCEAPTYTKQEDSQ